MATLEQIIDQWDPTMEGKTLFRIVSELYPICRSITGNGLRQSLQCLQQLAPLKIREIPTGTKVFDWEVTKEWNILDAYIKNSRGERVIDFQQSNLHVVNYSIPIKGWMSKEELKPYVWTLPETPDWIPYRTSYYKESWGFCMSQHQWEALPDDHYEILIDSTLKSGHLSYGELRIQGATDDEILISAHSCHPSLCNDNLSGMVIAATLARYLASTDLRYSYRFLWGPGTIGAITWLALNENIIPRIQHGFVLSCLGDTGPFNYKRSRQGKTECDLAVEHVLLQAGHKYSIHDFTPIGYDERQYCSPGINLPVGCFMRTPNGQYPQYHTSADDLTLVSPEALAESTLHLLNIIFTLENNHRYLNLNPKCEPQLGRRGLYSSTGGICNSDFETALLWILNLSDGTKSLLECAHRSGISFRTLAVVSKSLETHGLITKLT